MIWNKIKQNCIIDPDMEGKLTIRKTNNGFYIIYYEQLITEENKPISYGRRFVSFDEDICRYDIDESIENKLEDREKSMYNLLLFIKNYFEVMYNKHKPVNLVVDFENLEQKEFEKVLQEEECQEIELKSKLNMSKKEQLIKLVDKFYNKSREICEVYTNDILQRDFIIDEPYDKLRKFIEKL